MPPTPTSPRAEAILLSVATGLAARDRDCDAALRWAAAAGFDAVEVSGPHLAAMLADPVGMRRRASDYGIAIAALAPMLNLLEPEPAAGWHPPLPPRAERLARFRACLAAAEAAEVPTVVTYGGSAFGMFFWGAPAAAPDHPTHHEEENLRRWAETFAPLAEEAERRGVRIAFETAPRGGGHGNVAHAPELWERMFQLLPSPALGLSFDPSHLVWLQIGPVEAVIRDFAARIFHVDGKDTEIFADRLARQGIWGNAWWRYRLPGDGSLDWGSLVATLRAVGYAGAISIENEDALHPGAPGCERALRYLRQFVPCSR